MSERTASIPVATPDDIRQAMKWDNNGRNPIEGKRTLKLRFPVDVFQTDARVIEIPLGEPGRGVFMFDQGYRDMVLELMGTFEGERFLEEQANAVDRKLFISQIH